MTSAQALMILDQATAQLNVNRQTHNQIMEALKVIKDALQSLERRTVAEMVSR
jgi:hypothetical protein